MESADGDAGGARDLTVHHRLAWALQGLGEAMYALAQRFGDAEGLHTTDAQALAVLARAGRPLATSELAHRLELTTSATTRLIDRLDAAGHVTRRDDVADRRVVLVAHTAQAEQAARAWFAPLAERLVAHLEAHDPATQAAIVGFLEAVVDEVDATGERREA